jgi:hypothetical protein
MFPLPQPPENPDFPEFPEIVLASTLGKPFINVEPIRKAF